MTNSLETWKKYIKVHLEQKIVINLVNYGQNAIKKNNGLTAFYMYIYIYIYIYINIYIYTHTNKHTHMYIYT